MNIVKMLCVVRLDGYYSAFDEMTQEIKYIFNLDKLRHNPMLTDKIIERFESDFNFDFFMELDDSIEEFNKKYPYVYGDIQDFKTCKEIETYLNFEMEESMDSIVKTIIGAYEYDSDIGCDYAILNVLYDVDTGTYFVQI